MIQLFRFSLVILFFVSLFISTSKANDNKTDKTQTSIYKIVVFTDLEESNINVSVPEGQISSTEYFSTDLLKPVLISETIRLKKTFLLSLLTIIF
jgi:hypothetical protein